MELEYLQDINFFTTYQCNSRCQNCFIWQGQRQSPDKNELEALDCALDMIISQELKKPSHFPARLIFIKKITDYYRGIQRDLPCMALKSGIVINLYGDVFPNCPAMMKAIGNLHEQSLSDIWQGKKAYEKGPRSINSSAADAGMIARWSQISPWTEVPWKKNMRK